MPEVTRIEPEIKDVYGGLLDDLNAKYERLLSLFQQLLDNTKDSEADRKVSHKMPFHSFIMPRSVMVGESKINLEFKCAQN